MDNIISWVQMHWVQIGLVVVTLHTFLKAIRDAIDTTPETDDNWFERVVTIIGKVVNYITTGKRA